MDGRGFDQWVRRWESRESRRQALGGLVGGALALGLGTLGRAPVAVEARKRWSERKIIRIIEDAADHYNQPRKAMVRVARCESNLDPYAVNRAGPYYGLFQFLKSTWRGTPYGNENIFDPRANARAAAWMWKQGRRNEWACQ
jgi:soluble lytic murein transglycosylase-like protein